jgi:hypothetical protein
MEELLRKKFQVLTDIKKHQEGLIKELVINHQDMYYDHEKTQIIYALKHKIDCIEAEIKKLYGVCSELKTYYNIKAHPSSPVKFFSDESEIILDEICKEPEKTII